MERDAEHLRLLSLFHYARGGITGLFSCFFVIHIVMGLILMTVSTFAHAHDAPPIFFGLIFVIIGSVLFLGGWTCAALTLYAGRCLAWREHPVFCQAVAAINCVFLPYGTILGVFTLMVLQRPAARILFDQPPVAK